MTDKTALLQDGPRYCALCCTFTLKQMTVGEGYPYGMLCVFFLVNIYLLPFNGDRIVVIVVHDRIAWSSQRVLLVDKL